MTWRRIPCCAFSFPLVRRRAITAASSTTLQPPSILPFHCHSCHYQRIRWFATRGNDAGDDDDDDDDFKVVVQESSQQLQPKSQPAATGNVRQREHSNNNSNPTLEWKKSSHSTSEFVTHVLVDKGDEHLSVQDLIDRVLQTILPNDNPDQQQQQHVLLDSDPNVITTTSSGQTANKEKSATDTYTAQALIHLGAIWYLPATAPRDPSLGSKPIRLSQEMVAAGLALQAGDYLRIHHMPRRFRDVYQYDWSKRRTENNNNDDNNNNNNNNNDDCQPGVIVEQDERQGWMVIDKPANVPYVFS